MRMFFSHLNTHFAVFICVPTFLVSISTSYFSAFFSRNITFLGGLVYRIFLDVCLQKITPVPVPRKLFCVSVSRNNISGFMLQR